MEKVNELLRQAWHEALSQGVMITDVDFHVAETIDGDFHLVHPSIASHLVEVKREKTND